METTEIISRLESGRKKEVLNALKAIKKQKLYNLCPEIYAQFLLIRNNPNAWEQRAHMIEIFGLTCYKPCESEIITICNESEDFDLVTIYASECLVRLTRTSLNDGLPVIKLLRTNSYSLTMGALNALGYDQMTPNESQIREILNSVHTPGDLPIGYLDPRYGLAAAAVNWDKELVQRFLEECLTSNDDTLKYVAKNSLAGKSVKLR